MARGVSSRRYAQAIFQIAQESQSLGRWQSDLEIMDTRLRDSQLVGLLENPKVLFVKKQELLRTVLAELSPLALNLAYLLVAKTRLGILHDLIVEYHHLVDVHEGREHVEITTALPLEKDEQEVIKAKLAKAMLKEVVVTTRINPAIVGGLVLRIGDQVIDGSVHTRLQGLKKSLAEAEAAHP